MGCVPLKRCQSHDISMELTGKNFILYGEFVNHSTLYIEQSLNQTYHIHTAFVSAAGDELPPPVVEPDPPSKNSDRLTVRAPHRKNGRHSVDGVVVVGSPAQSGSG